MTLFIIITKEKIHFQDQKGALPEYVNVFWRKVIENFCMDHVNT